MGPAKAILAAALAAGLAFPVCGAADDARHASARAQMVGEVVDMWEETRRYIGGRGPDESVLEVLGKVPRHEFVPAARRADAYANRPQPIGHGQTISQPYIVALMTALAEIDSDSRVLEVGTGSGYQAAVLAEIAREVFTIEIIEALAGSAAERLERLGYDNVRVRHGDGYYGMEEHAPFDAILVTAAAGHIPPPLVEQLKVGGRMVIPVGSGFAVQQLVLVQKRAPDEVQVSQILPVSFVPLTGGH